MGSWSSGTILPEVFDFDPRRLSGKSFWYAAEDVISEKDLCEKRADAPGLKEDLFAGIDDSVFRAIEEEFFSILRERFGLSGCALLYDTTNFFTYIEGPARSQLARRGHNKDSKHHLRQVGLAMCVEKTWGIPLFYRIYRGNSHDSKAFAGLIDELVTSMHTGFREVEELVLVLDKGNNSKENFKKLEGRFDWVGSLVPSHYRELLEIPLDSYSGECDEIKYYRCQKKIMGIECSLVMTYNAKLAKKQSITLSKGIEELKAKLQAKWLEYKRTPKALPKGIKALIKESRYGKYLSVTYKNGKLDFVHTESFDVKKKYSGKNILFCSNLKAESDWIIRQYKAKERIEDSFKLLKDPGLIRWQPARHFTDSKIRAFAFCCIMALILLRIMQLKSELAGMKMSPAVLKEELSDIKDIIILYDDKTARRKITTLSSIQIKLWKLFNLDSIEKLLTIHNKYEYLQ